MATTKQSEIERPLPSNIEAEKSILGAVILDNSAADEALYLAAEDFFLLSNRRIFESIRRLRDRNESIDTVSIMSDLQQREVLEAAGGIPYISSLADGIPRVTSVPNYCRMVREKALLRRAIHLCSAFQEASFSGAEGPEKLFDGFSQQIMDLAFTAAGEESVGKTYRNAAVSAIAALDDPQTIRIFLGLTEIDNVTGGFRATELVTLTAGTGVGKTLLAQLVRRIACQRGIHGLYCSGEMTAEHLLTRELATEAGVSHWKMRRPEKLEAEDRKSLISAAGRECQTCTILDGELSVQKIRIAARRRRRAGNLGLVVVDYDELVDAPGKDDLERQAYLIRALKAMSVELRICVIVISQLRKPLTPQEAARPRLERIYGSGAKSKHSSWIIFVDREYVRELQGDETAARVCILKGRDGRVGQAEVQFNVETLRFQDAPKLRELPPPRKSRRGKDRNEDGDE